MMDGKGNDLVTERGVTDQGLSNVGALGSSKRDQGNGVQRHKRETVLLVQGGTMAGEAQCSDFLKIGYRHFYDVARSFEK